MLKNNLLVGLLFVLCLKAIAQNKIYTGKHRSKDNPYYWKNDRPFTDYWQQDVSYKIKVNIDDQTNILDGEEELSYWNNSPDTLYEVFFHLYQNAFQPESYCHSLYKENNTPVRFGAYEAAQLGTVIESFNIYDNEAELELDNTILKVKLKKPILPGQEIVFDIKFKTYFDTGTLRRRMKMYYVGGGNKHFNVVHWYPRISVYDRKFGWTTDQHLGHEFYGDFGDFDVEITMPHQYIMDGTGVLQNRKEVLPDDLRAKLDIKNFANKEWESEPSVIIEPDSSIKKTWKFKATNVHDFAFTADPTYRIGEVEWNGIKCISLAQEGHAAKWQNAAEYTKKCIEVYSNDIGMYAYPKMIVADASDGMEYPMLTLDGGKDPTYRGLLAHEIGHNWFYGMIGSNETYRAALDEGFTQFLTAWALESIEGKYLPRDEPKNWYVKRFLEPTENRYKRAYSKYYSDAMKGHDPSLSTHSDDFGGAIRHGGGYGHVYYKTATMLYNLRYVLGDELFLSSLQYYFQKWKIAHPYVEDFRAAVIEHTKMDLNWFFDQWLETSKSTDYRVKNIKNLGEYKYKVTFERMGQMQMPINFTTYDKLGNEQSYHIPNKWYVVPTEDIVLPKWEGWGNVNKTYTTEIQLKAKLQNLKIDTSLQMADINCLDNSKKFPLSVKFDSKLSAYPKRESYEVFIRPDVWYNAYDGMKTGINIRGHHMNYYHKFELTFWGNTGIGQRNFPTNAITRDELINYDPYSFRFKYNTPIKKFGQDWYFNTTLKQLDGLHSYQGGIYRDRKRDKFSISLLSLSRPNSYDLNYLLVNQSEHLNYWNYGQYNNNLDISYTKKYKNNHSFGQLKLEFRHPSYLSDYDFKYLRATKKHTVIVNKLILKTRWFAQYGTGSNIPLYSALYMGGANLEELSHNKFTRSTGFIPYEMGYYNNGGQRMHMQGGLNIRSLSGLAITNGIGTSGASFNFEIELDDYVNFKPKRLSKYYHVDAYVFGGVGSMIDASVLDREIDVLTTHYEYGVGMAFTIKKFWVLNQVKPFTFRVDVPLKNSIDNTSFVLIGINRAI